MSSTSMLQNYFPILLFILIGILVGTLPIVLGSLLGPRRPYMAKQAPYECGFPPFEDARRPFEVKYYLIAIFFIIFDLEIAFLFPWAVVLKKMPAPAFIGMAIFLGFLVVGFIYEWKKGALEWE
jgi:NADH-quinone oxidoreductase subunit A